MTTQSTVAEVDPIEEMLQTLEDIAQKQRDPAVPEGELLGSTDTEGAPTNWKKQKSMVNMNGVALPERVQYWHNNLNQYVMIATAMIPQVLGEKMEDGTPVFTRKPPAGYKPRELNMELQCPIEQNGRRVHLGIGNGNGFYSEDDYEAHMENLHPRETATIRRQEERAERKQELDLQRETANALLAVVKGGAPQETPSAFYCEAPGCPRFFDSEKGRTFHQRKDHR